MRFVALALVLAGCAVEDPGPGVDPAVPAAPGEARAGVVVEGGEAALFGGIGAEGQVGDLKLYNDRVRFIVSPPGRRHGWVDVGGTVVDADFVGSDGAGQDNLDDLFLAFGISRLFEADAVSIVADGSDGGPAIVRAEGTDVAFDLWARGLEQPELMAGPLGLTVVRDFVLAPDADALRIDTTIRAGAEPVSSSVAEGFMFGREDFQAWFAGRGLVDEASGEVASAGYVGHDRQGALALWGDPPLRVSPSTAALAVASLSLFNHERLELEPGQEVRLTAWVGLGPDTAAVEAARRSLAGESLVALDGVVRDEAGDPVPHARVHVVGADETYGFAAADEAGRYAARVPAGSWSLVATARQQRMRLHPAPGRDRYSPLAAERLRSEALGALTAPASLRAAGRWTPEPVAVELDADATVDLTLPAAGALRIDAGGAGAVVDVVATDAIPALDPELAEAVGVSTSPDVARLLTAGGASTVAVPPGSWRVTAGRGWRHERSEQVVTVGAGETVDVAVDVAEAVPADGWISVDPHLHASPSMDGEVAMEDRLVACAATGLQVPITTDHDRYADYRPLADALDLPFLDVIPGSEVTTIVRGHANLYPVQWSPGARNGGALVWWDQEPTTTQALFDRLAEHAPAAQVQLAHGSDALGMPTAAGFGPEGPDRNSRWSWSFDSAEIITAGDAEAWRDNRDDWFAYVNLGAPKVVVGSSDSHDLDRACGLGRTDVFVGDGPADGDAVLAAMRAGRTVAASGVTLRAELVGTIATKPGEVLAEGSATLAIRVLGPSWVQPAVLRVYRDGELLQEWPLGIGSNGVIAEIDVPVEASDDAWFAVEVDGGSPQGQAFGGDPPYALTGALFLDPQGDGWEAPAAR